MNLFELAAKVTIDYSNYEKGVKDVVAKGESLSRNLKKGLGNVAKFSGKAFLATTKAVAAGTATAATAVATLIGQATKNYAEYEQLVGGVDTLFKDSAEKVKAYAADAYKTAGLSANNYMDTVTGFSASLLQSLGGDTEKAAEIAHMAITDMADNANKMGSSIESIQVAYQGFAKGNYTMLDNLKLGYGGTAREMARLVNDSGVLGDAYIDLADTQNLGAALQEVGFAKIIEAINKVQEETGIMGTTVQEAEQTISGSLSAASASFHNLLTGVADDNADLDVLVDEFVESAGIAAENIIPRIDKALQGTSKLIQKVTPIIVREIPKIINTLLPELLKSGVSIIEEIMKGFQQNPDTVTNAVLSIVDLLGNAFIDLFPEIIETGTSILVNLIDAFAAHPDEVILGAIKVIGSLVGGLLESVGDIIDAAGRLIAALVTGFIDHWPEIKEEGARMLEKVLDGWEHALSSIPKAVDKFLTAITDSIAEKWEGVKNWFGGLWDNLFNRDANVNVNINKYENSSPKPTRTSGSNRSRSRYTAVSIDGSFASGLDYVPWDGFIAELHKGERVLTKEENKRSGLTVIQNIYSEAKTAADLMEDARYAQEEALFIGV